MSPAGCIRASALIQVMPRYLRELSGNQLTNSEAARVEKGLQDRESNPSDKDYRDYFRK